MIQFLQALRDHGDLVLQLFAMLAAIGLFAGGVANFTKDRAPRISAFFAMIAAGTGDVLKFLVSLWTLVTGGYVPPSTPPMLRKLLRGPFDNAAAGGVTVLGKKPPTSSRIRLGALAWGGIFLAGYFFVSLAMMTHSSVQPASWDAPTPGVLEGCNAAQLQDAVQTTQDGLREEACVQAYIEHTPDPTYEGALQCAGTTLDLVEQIVQDFKDAHKAPASDAGVMKLEPPTVFEDHLARMHHAADGGAK